MKKIIEKIIKNFLKPHKIPVKILSKLNYYYNLNQYDQIIFENDQNNIFNSLSLNRINGINNLDIIKKNLDLDINLNREMSSEHEVLFSSISLNQNLIINDILEIGTFDGFNALLLSKLFPKSKIDTIDLPEDDDEFINFYDRKKKVSDFVNKRNNLLSKNININFIPLNSLNLINYKKKYDLIWIDGAHGYPTACIDIINSLNLINNNGLILCDDIFINMDHSESDKIYHSIAAYETLNELKKENLIEFRLIFKRLDPQNNCLSQKRKFVAILNKV
jgi:predicted O-methyltransferase YrrM